MSDNNTHTATAGDTWARIALDYYGEETLMWKLIEANPLHAQIVIFEGGELLKIPEIEETDFKAAMPPWRK